MKENIKESLQFILQHPAIGSPLVQHAQNLARHITLEHYSLEPQVTDERAAFEGWCIRKGYSTNKWHGDESSYVDGYTLCGWEGWSARALLSAPPAAETPFRCFHCDETFSDRESAALHFGTSEVQNPACLIDIAEYRAMEQRMLSYNQEDAEIHREMASLQSSHTQALKREEEIGYARGLRDAAKYPDEVAAAIQEAKPVAAGDWRLVPYHPTDAMVDAMVKALRERGIEHVDCVDTAHAYRAMLAAAPQEQAPADKDALTKAAGECEIAVRTSDQSLTLTFSSCRAASAFEKAIRATPPTWAQSQPQQVAEKGGE